METIVSIHGPNGPNKETDSNANDDDHLVHSNKKKNRHNHSINVLESVDEIREQIYLQPYTYQPSYHPCALDLSACRDFVVDKLGTEEEIPLRLTYTDGIQEIRSRLMSRYGDEKIGEAMHVVYDLIENTNNSSGLGDDGDRWASWRFAHQHRHDDLCNPGTPRFPGLVLPASDHNLINYPSHQRPTWSLTERQSECKPQSLSYGSPEQEIKEAISNKPQSRTITGALKRMGSKRGQSANHCSRFSHRHPAEKARLSWRHQIRAALKARIVKKPKANHTIVSEKAPVLPAVQLSPSFQFDGASDLDSEKFASSQPFQIKLGMLLREIAGRRLLGNYSRIDWLPSGPFVNRRVSIVAFHDDNNKHTKNIRISPVPYEWYRVRDLSLSNLLKLSHDILQQFSWYRLYFELFRSLYCRPFNHLPETYGEVEPDEPAKHSFRENFGVMSHEQVLLEPKKYNPNAPMGSEMVEDVFQRYQSIADVNPFQIKASCSDNLALRKCYLPPIPPLGRTEKGEPLTPEEIWVVPSSKSSSGLHKVYRTERSAPNLLYRGSPTDYQSNARSTDPSFTTFSNDQMISPQSTFEHSLIEDGTSQTQHSLPKSLSDTNFHRSTLAVRRNSVGSKPQLTIDSRASPIKHWLNTIDAQDIEYAANYKMEVSQEPGETTKVIRSPLKRFFGEKGILGRTTSQKDLPDPRYKKPEGYSWGEKFKHRIDEMSRDISAALPSFDRSKRPCYPHGPSNFPVRLSPYAQGDLYMQLELLLNTEVNRFITHQFEYGKISIDSIKKIVEVWKSKGRPQVIGFRFDLATQRDLIILNAEKLQFCGSNNFNRPLLYGLFDAWKSLAREVSVRTFCQPDSAIRKHLHDAEKILELIDAAPDSMLAFQEMRTRAITDILKQEKLDRQRELNGVERVWSPTKFN